MKLGGHEVFRTTPIIRRSACFIGEDEDHALTLNADSKKASDNAADVLRQGGLQLGRRRSREGLLRAGQPQLQ
jgi:hypothetical protein